LAEELSDMTRRSKPHAATITMIINAKGVAIWSQEISLCDSIIAPI